MSTKAPPPKSSLAPPTQGGSSGKYIAIVALLGFGLVGLVVWKNYATEAPPVVTIPSAKPTSAPAPPNPKEDDVPPPPPIEDSGPETGPPKSTGPATNWAACDAKVCGGKVTGELESALAFRAKTAHKCYDDALGQDPTLKGAVKISIRVAANGNICSAGVAENDLGNPMVAGCIANRFRQAGHFPAPVGGCLDVAVPISLMPPH